MIPQTRGVHAYRQVQVQSRSPLELVVMLYDGALASLAQASAAAAHGDTRQRGAAISKTLSIIGTLQENLNLAEGGAIAVELDRLYDYVKGRLLDVTLKKDPDGLAEIQALLAGLRDAWHQIATQPPQAASS